MNFVFLQFHPSAFIFSWTSDIFKLFVALFQLTLLEDAWNPVGVTVCLTLKQHVLSFYTISQLSRFHLSHKMTWPDRLGP